jgi:nickel-dependent lactate racemase
MYIEGNSLCSYLKQTKMSFYSSSTKSQNRMVEQVLPGGVGNRRMGDDVGKRSRMVITVHILCTHVCKWKMILLKLLHEWGRGEE